MGNQGSNRGVARLPWSRAAPIAIMVGFFTWLIGTLVGLTTQDSLFWSMDIAGTSTLGAFFFWAIFRLATGRDDGLSFYITVVLAPGVRLLNHDPGAIAVWAIQAAYCCVLMVCCLSITRFRPEWWEDFILDPRPAHLREINSAVDDLEVDQIAR